MQSCTKCREAYAGDVIETTSRRESNRERTRAALYDAVLTLIETEGPEALTADRVADAAGVSRRTFFNYYPSIDALIAAGLEHLLWRLSDAMASRPAEESLHDSAIGVIEDVLTLDVLTSTTRVWRAIDCSPAAGRYALEALGRHNEALAHEWARERLARAGVASDALQESVIMGAYGAAFDAARRHWLRTHEGPVDEEDRQVFLATVRRAFDQIRPILDVT